MHIEVISDPRQGKLLVLSLRLIVDEFAYKWQCDVLYIAVVSVREALPLFSILLGPMIAG